MTPIMLGSNRTSRLGPIIFFIFLFCLLFINRTSLSQYFNNTRGHPREWSITTSKTTTTPHPIIPPSAQTPVDSEIDWSWASDISVVYTWVNGSVPEQAALRHQFGGPKISGRFRDNEDLRYSMRTWVNNVPWHKGKIFIVSPTPPIWLNLQHPRIQWIDQNSIIPKEFQPVFSSNAIEPYLYRIQGLSERFIVLNDDYMIDKKLHPSDFFTNDRGTKFFFSRMKISDDPRPKVGIWFKSLLNTVTEIEKVYGKSNDQTKFLKHAPYVYYKSAMEGVHKRFGEIFKESNLHKFRHEKDVLLPYLHHSYVINEGSKNEGMSFEIVNWQKTQKDSTLIIWTNDITENIYNIERIGSPLFLTINDSMGRNEPGAAELQLKQFYRSRYGHLRSPFEKAEYRI